MKIKGKKVQQGIKIKAAGLTEKERKIIKKAMREKERKKKAASGRKQPIPTKMGPGVLIVLNGR